MSFSSVIIVRVAILANLKEQSFCWQAGSYSVGEETSLSYGN